MKECVNGSNTLCTELTNVCPDLKHFNELTSTSVNHFWMPMGLMTEGAGGNSQEPGTAPDSSLSSWIVPRSIQVITENNGFAFAVKNAMCTETSDSYTCLANKGTVYKLRIATCGAGSGKCHEMERRTHRQ